MIPKMTKGQIKRFYATLPYVMWMGGKSSLEKMIEDFLREDLKKHPIQPKQKFL